MALSLALAVRAVEEESLALPRRVGVGVGEKGKSRAPRILLGVEEVEAEGHCPVS